MFSRRSSLLLQRFTATIQPSRQLRRAFHYSVPPQPPPFHGTTILCVRKHSQVCIAGDGMVSQGNMIVKPNARKIRRISPNVVLGFAGTTADCFTLVERLEAKLEEYPGQLLRASVELAKQWRTDRYLRHLEAVLIVADDRVSLEVTGNGDVLEAHDGILGVGSGGPFAVAAARALWEIDGLTARDVTVRSMKIAGDMCCHTNDRLLVEVIDDAVPYVRGDQTLSDTSTSTMETTSACGNSSTATSNNSISKGLNASAEQPTDALSDK